MQRLPRTLVVPALVLLGALAGCEPRRGSPAASPPASKPHPATPPTGAPAERVLSREAATTALCTLLRERDRDCDRRLTRDDERRGAGRDYPHRIAVGDEPLELRTLSEAAQLVQELVLALGRGQGESVSLDLGRVRADPALYLAYRIEHHFWDGLTRRIDAEPAALARALADPKLSAPPEAAAELCPAEPARCPAEPPPPAAPPREQHVYVPAGDHRALEVFSRAAEPGRITVQALPSRVTPEWMTATTARGAHGLLTLALDEAGRGRPFVVPGGRFNEMYGWDSFFIVWGLVQSPDRLELARSMVDNHAYEIRHYGKILNANRSYYLTRSQPPFFTSAIGAVLERLPDDAATRAWLEPVLESAFREYDTVWSAAPRRSSECEGDTCLARYFGEGRGEPPEVEPGHFAWFYQQHALAHGHCPRPAETPASQSRFVACAAALAGDYRAGRLRDPQIDEFFVNDRCVRESGHDTTYRWFDGGRERCSEFVPVELTALVYKYELDLAGFLARYFGGSFRGRTTAELCARAAARSRLATARHWDEARGAFFDWDTKHGRRSSYLAATTLAPLWASAPNVCGTALVTPERARRVRDVALAELEVDGGLLASSPRSLAAIAVPQTLTKTASGELERRPNERQWEAPNGWAPHQMLAWFGLAQHGLASDARRLAYRWLSTIVENAADYHGTVPEKFDVVRKSHRVFQEYGNVNTEFSYIASEGFGWMNASFLVGLELLDAEQRRALAERRPVEAVFGE